jgi:hypothetical protein
MAKKKNKMNITAKVPVAPCRGATEDEVYQKKAKKAKKPKKPKKFQVDALDVAESDGLFKGVVRGLPIAWKRPARGRNGNTYNPSKADQKDFGQAIISVIVSADEPQSVHPIRRQK